MPPLQLPPFAGLMFDMDGVIWRGSEAVPGAAEFLASARKAGRKILFATNNASAHRSVQVTKLQSMNIDATVDEVITSASATAAVLFERFGSLRIHVMGTEGLAQELSEAGHQVLEVGTERPRPAHAKIDCVVAGINPQFDYQRLNAALQCFLRDGAKFVACNDNPLYPREDGFYPGAGALVQALAFCAGRQPDLIIGKPHRPILDYSLNRIGLDPQECVMFGDSLTHDIAWVQQAGMATVYLLSGVGTMHEIETTGIRPTFVADSLAECLV